MTSMYRNKAFRDAKIKGEYPEFPDGFEGDVVIVRTHDLLDGHFGPRFIANLVDPETGLEGSARGSLQGKSLAYTYSMVKSLFASAQGVDPANQDKVDEATPPELIEKANSENTFEGTYVRIKVRYKPNKHNPEKPFVNCYFSPCLDEKGNVRKLA